jgi:hypothetical protein
VPGLPTVGRRGGAGEGESALKRGPGARGWCQRRNRRLQASGASKQASHEAFSPSSPAREDLGLCPAPPSRTSP